jgi:hypothetical protein
MHACFMDALPYEDDGSVKIFNVVEGGETDGYFETLQAFAACISLSDSPSVAQGIASIGAGMVILGATGVLRSQTLRMPSLRRLWRRCARSTQVSRRCNSRGSGAA